MRSVLYVIEREVREKLRDRGFLVFSAFMVLLVVAGPVVSVVSAGSGEGERLRLAAVGRESREIAETAEVQGEETGTRVTVREAADAAEARELVEREEVDAAVVDGRRVLLTNGATATQADLLQSAASDVRARGALSGAGLSQGEVDTVLDPAPLVVERPDQVRDFGARLFAVGVGLSLLFITVYLYGYWIANGVVEEKSSRVAEIVVSATKTWHLLAGKVIGLGLLGLGQFAVLGTIALLASSLLDLEIPPATWSVGGFVVLWFVLGYAFYSCLFAVSGSLVSRQEQLQYTQIPILVLIFGGFFLAINNLTDLDSTLVRVLSFFPPFTPLLMLVRMGLGEVSTPEVVAAIVLMVVSTAGVILLASRLYSGSFLSFGSRVKLSDAWRSTRKR